MVEVVFSAVAQAFSFHVFLAITAGLVLGIFLGAIPGLGAMIGIGVCLPLTFEMEVITAVPFIAAVYKGSLFGGSISAILINTPGTSAAAATCFDGYPLSQQGFSKKAIQGALYASGCGDMFSDIVLVVGSLALARVAMKFGPPEMFWVLVFALIMTGSLAGKMVSKGIVSISIGLLLGCVGLDPIVSVPRFDFIGDMGKLEGIDMVAFLLGAFAISEVFSRIETARLSAKARGAGPGSGSPVRLYGPSFSLADAKYCLKAYLIACGMGTLIGIVPGMGATAGAFISYGTVSQAYGDSKGRAKFGEGNLAGVVAAEAGNNAVSGANLLPLLTLGVPGSAEAALVLAALMLHGVNVGPTIFKNHGPEIYTIFVAFIVSNILLIFIGQAFIKPLTKVLKSNPNIVFPVVMMICFTGVYSLNRRIFDMVVMVGIGLLSFVLRKARIPVAPMVIAFVLSTQLELLFRQSLAISIGDLGIFVQSPISLSMMVLCVVSFLYVIYRRYASREN